MPPRPGSGPKTEIAPQLESVLRNLNVNLEDELTRYRRQRHGRVPPPPPPRRAAQRQTIDLISVPASASDEPAAEAAGQPATPPPPPPNPFLQTVAEADTKDTIDPPDTEQLTDVEAAPPISDDPDQPGPEPDGAALPIHSGNTPADGYLESSEELLKSLEEEQTESASVPEPYSPERKNNSLLKLAGLVLVVLGGIGVGFAITYPSQLQNLRSRLWPAGDAETTSAETSEIETVDGNDSALPEIPDADSESTATASEAATDGYRPPGPDLSTREFKELDDVEDLVTLDLDGNGSSTAPVTSPLPNPAQSPLPNPAEATPGAAAPVETGTTPTAGTAPATPLPTDATGSNFYVIATYTGDASLNKAREVVPDAFVRNFKAGARIQLAAFDNRAQAEQQVAFLTQQGVVVELFGPTNE